jgi:hypothetical protein
MNNTSISLLMPTRGRPELVERLFASVAETTAKPERMEIVVYVDEDDIRSHHLRTDACSITRIIGPRLSMGGYNSACLARAKGDIIILANDDMVLRTRGWDDKVMAMDAKEPDKIYLAYPNDLFKRGDLCTFPVLSRLTCELLVEPYPAAYRGAFIDVHLFDIFKRLQHAGFDRIRYLDDVVFEHLHYRTGEAIRDETYMQRGRFADDATFIAMADARSASAYRLLNALRGEELPEFKEADCHEYIPTGLPCALKFFSRQLLFDKELPLRWRGYLWYWFIGRYMAGRGMLRPFVS